MADPAPSAPPLQQQLIEKAPPSYNAIAYQQYPPAAERNRFVHSMQYAGASVGRWFGVHEDPELRGWQRAGTLPRNATVGARYSSVPRHVDAAAAPQNAAQERAPVDLSHEHGRQSAGERRRWRAGTLRRVVTTFSRVVKRKEPSRQEVLDSLPKYWPWMTVLIGLVEVGLLIAVTVTQGLAPISLMPQVKSESVLGFNNQTEQVSRQIIPNFFIGPSKPGLIHCGGMYTPCMRENVEFQVQAARDRLAESTNLRCCHAIQFDQCGMLPQDVCINRYGGEILGGASRCRDEMNETLRETCFGGVTLHPCCVGILGECVVTTEENCTFQEGYWHPEALLCSDVGTDCFNDICEFSWIHRTIGQQPLQTLRFVAAIFLYDGAIHLVVVGLLKVYNSWTIERRIGFLRLLCVYILSGIGGFLVSGIFDSTTASVGGSGALFGLLGLLLVEVIQGWKWVKKPCLELIKLVIFIIVLLILGTLPYIDNFSQIGGFIFGVLASFIFVPYINVGKWDRAKKLCLILTAIPIILAMYLVGFVAFFNLPNPEFCSPYCGYINCIPYTSTFCENFITTVLSSFPITLENENAL